MLHKKLITLLTLVFFLASFGVTFAFWASSIQGNTQVGSGLVNIGTWLPPGWTGVTQTGGSPNITLNQIGTEGYPMSGNYVLMSDINWGGAFTPLGYDPVTQTTTPFTGEFRGNGYSISNVTITSSGAYDYAGLFARNNGLIEGVSLINITVSHVRSINGPTTSLLFGGALAGENQANGVILNSYVGGTSSVNVSLSLTNTTANGTQAATAYSGGLVGQNLGSIIESHAHATVSAHASTETTRPNSGGTALSFAGGLVGINNNANGILNTYATGNVTASANISRTNNNSASTANTHAGGLVGRNLAANSGVSNSFATGNVTATITSSNADTRINYYGGLIGLGGSTSSFRRTGQTLTPTITPTGGTNTLNSTGEPRGDTDFRLQSWVTSNLLWSTDSWTFDGTNYPRLIDNKY